MHALGRPLSSVTDSWSRFKVLYKRVTHYLPKYIGAMGIRDGSLAFVRMSARKWLVTISVPQARSGILLRPHTTDRMIFEQVFVHREYDIPLDIKPRTIIDAGAHIGLASVLFANRYPDAKILSIEPEASNLAILKMNASGYENIDVVHGALWDRRTTLEIQNPGAANWAFRVQESPNAGTVEAFTVDDLLNMLGGSAIDILKLDIEGAEKEVFSRASSWLGSVKVLIVELHDRFKTGCRDAVYGAISKYDFAESQLGEYVVFVRSGPIERQVSPSGQPQVVSRIES